MSVSFQQITKVLVMAGNIASWHSKLFMCLPLRDHISVLQFRSEYLTILNLIFVTLFSTSKINKMSLEYHRIFCRV